MIRRGLLPKLHFGRSRQVPIRAASFSSRLTKWHPATSPPNLCAAKSPFIKSISYTRPLREDGARPRDLAAEEGVRRKLDASDSLRPETIEKSDRGETNAKEAPKTDLLLSEQTVSNKEQRRADWAILKEMSKYLWPKACQVVGGIHAGFKLTRIQDDLGARTRVITALALLVGSKVRPKPEK